VYKHRLVSVCLLVAYGIPAGAGPFWHRHVDHLPDSSCGTHCCASHAAGDDRSVETDVDRHARDSACGASCKEHGKTQRCCIDRPKPTHAAEPRVLSSACEQHACSDHCAICAFYAQFQSATCADVCWTNSFLLSWAIPAQISAETEWLRGFSARGPPLALFGFA
jgi:hypothetical protein